MALKKSIAIACGIFLFSMYLPAYAQSLGTQSLGGSPVQFTLAPQNPGPHQLVDILVQGIGNFLGNSNIVWSVNGETVLEGVGQREFKFTTRGLGQTTTVSVAIQTTDYGTIRHTWMFNPSRIDLVWQAQTSVPPFYRGLALPSPGSQITVAAIPEIMQDRHELSPSDLSFQWKINDTADPSQSGLGLDTLTFTADDLEQSADVQVDVEEPSGTTVGHGEVTIPFTDPLIDFYIDDPLRGVLHNEALLGSYSLTGAQATFRAEPYYFSSDSFGDGSLTYDWQLNEQSVTGPNAAQGELTLRQTGSGQGNGTLSVSLQNTDSSKLLQSAESTIDISFGGNNSSVFGL